MLTRLCEQVLEKRYQPVSPEARDRLAYELNTLGDMG
jgi:hypothetical protein